MAVYDPPHYNVSGTYNEFDYSNNIVDATTIDTTIFVHKSGDSMVGSLNVPALNLYDVNGSLEFSDTTEQTTAFSQIYIDKITALESTTTDHLNTIDITFSDNSVQNTAFTNNLKTKVNNSNTALTNTTYTNSTLTTSISNNVYCANLTCGNINTSYLTTLTSNVQTQLNNISVPVNMATTDTTQTISGVKTFSSNLNTTGNYLQNGSSLLPIGTILMYAGSIPPNLFVACNGQSYDRILFSELFAVIGITYGSTTSTTFNIPDMRGMFVRGAGVNPTYNVSGLLGQIQLSSIASHSHDFNTVMQSKLTNADALTGINLLGVVGGALNTVFSQFASPIINFINNKTSAMYDNTGNALSGTETKPINISLTYMIKIR